MRRRIPLVALVLVLGALVHAGAALAAPPANDLLANATEITSLPFTDSVDITEATEGSGEGGCGPPRHTVWYRFTPPQDTVLRIKVTTATFGSVVSTDSMCS